MSYNGYANGDHVENLHATKQVPLGRTAAAAPVSGPTRVADNASAANASNWDLITAIQMRDGASYANVVRKDGPINEITLRTKGDGTLLIKNKSSGADSIIDDPKTRKTLLESIVPALEASISEKTPIDQRFPVKTVSPIIDAVKQELQQAPRPETPRPETRNEPPGQVRCGPRRCGPSP